MYLFLGDLSDPDTPRTHQAVALGASTASELWHEHGIPSRWLVGNHDVIEDGTDASTQWSMLMFSRHVNPGSRGFEVWSRPSVEVIGDVSFVSLPYTPRSHAYDPAEFVRTVEVTTRWVVVAGHLSIRGMIPGSETRELPRGRDVFFPLDECRSRWGSRALLLNGHYHTQQVHEGIHLPGSLEKLTFGEQSAACGWLIAEIGS